MGVRIINDSFREQACLFCSTTEWAFGPVFHDKVINDYHRAAEDRAESFLHYLVKHNYPDPRQLKDRELQDAFHLWLEQEAKQWAEKEI